MMRGNSLQQVDVAPVAVNKVWAKPKSKDREIAQRIVSMQKEMENIREEAEMKKRKRRKKRKYKNE